LIKSAPKNDSSLPLIELTKYSNHYAPVRTLEILCYEKVEEYCKKNWNKILYFHILMSLQAE
jgi:hypothetical protein